MYVRIYVLIWTHSFTRDQQGAARVNVSPERSWLTQ